MSLWGCWKDGLSYFVIRLGSTSSSTALAARASSGWMKSVSLICSTHWRRDCCWPDMLRCWDFCVYLDMKEEDESTSR